MADITLQTQPTRRMTDKVIDRIWRFFCSVRAAIAEIAILALLVLVGTLRGSEVPGWIGNGIPFLQPVVDKWYGWNVFTSVPFAAMLAILSIAVAVCTINRLPAIWQTISHPRLMTSRGWLRNAELSATYASSSTVTTLADDIGGVLKQQRYRVLSEQIGNDVHIYADKNRFAKLGTFPFHLALILILVGGIVASQYGFRDQEFIVVEGETRAVGHNTGLSVRLDRFETTYVPMGVARQFESTLTIIDGGKDVKSGSITVNHPITYQNATIYQSDFGTAKQFKITDASGNAVYQSASPIGIFNLKGNPDAPAGLVDLPSLGGQMVFAGPDIAPFNQPELDKLNLASNQIWAQLGQRDASGKMTNAPGIVLTLNQPAKIGNYTVTYQGTTNYSVMQVGYNPGVPIFIIAAVLLIGGLAATFYFPQRRVRGIVSTTPQGSMLQMAPLAKRDWSGKRDFLRIVEKATEKLGTPQHVKVPTKGSEWEEYTHSSTSTP
ncbi:MAG: cytochrome c biogenesis protein ResB [Thermomicrobiales bacterium]